MIKKEKILELKNITKSFQNLELFNNLNLKINKGEICCLLGPSGSGKTTLLRIASGLEKNYGGRIIKFGRPRFAYVFQTPRLLPWKTAVENLIFVQKNYKLENKKKLRELLFDLSGLREFKNSYPNQLSGGMQQRLELIRAFSIKADLVFLDEPFKSLDMKTRLNLQKMLNIIQAESKISIFLVTHNPEEALLLADRIYILGNDKKGIQKEIIVAKNRSERKINDPKLYAQYEKIMEIFSELVADIKYNQQEIKKFF